MKRFERDLYTGEATVLATVVGLEVLSALGTAVAKAVAAARAPRRKDGRTKVRIPIESIEHATGQLLRLSPEVEVLEPAALRASTIERLRRITSLYGGTIRRRD